MQPRQVVIPAARAGYDPAPRAAKSEADWIRQEASERSAKPRPMDALDEAVGRSTKIPSACLDGWRHPTTRRPFFVTAYYPHPPRLVVDKPETSEDAEAKARFFQATEITYVAIQPGESLTVQETRQRVLDALKAKAADSTPQARPGR